MNKPNLCQRYWSNRYHYEYTQIINFNGPVVRQDYSQEGGLYIFGKTLVFFCLFERDSVGDIPNILRQIHKN